MSQAGVKDRWQEALDQQLRRLQECQNSLNIQSCLACTKILECSIRKEYVNAVYESMNKGQGGGFEF